MPEPKDTNGNLLVTGQKYSVKMNDLWDETMYGPPNAPEELIFEAYESAAGGYAMPRFLKINGEVAGGRSPATYMYEHVKSEHISPKRKATRRPATNARWHGSRKYHPKPPKGGYRKSKKQTRRRTQKNRR
jgi:hypothetical protein